MWKSIFPDAAGLVKRGTSFREHPSFVRCFALLRTCPWGAKEEVMSVEIQHHQPGRVRRFAHIDRASYIAAQASITAKAPPIALNKLQLFDTLTYWPNVRTEAVPKLTGAETRLLAVYISVIPWEDFQDGRAMGSLSIAMLGARLGLDARRVRALRASVERKGAAWRGYNGANYQAPGEGFDLSAFLAMARVVYAEMQAAVAEVYSRREATKAISDQGVSKHPGGRLKTTRLIQASSQPPRGRGEEVQEKAESGSSPDNRRSGRPYGAAISTGANGTTESCSAGRASVSGGATPVTKAERAIIVATLSAARQASKSLRAATAQADVDRLNLAALCTSIVRALATIAPGFPVKTFEWAWREHGWRSIPALAVALDDPSTGNQAALLGAWVKGHFTTRDEWASNFKRMIRADEEAALAAGSATPATEDPAPASEEPSDRHQLHPHLLGAVLRYMRFLDPSEVMRWATRAQALGAPSGPPEYWAAWILDELPDGWAS